MIQFIIKSVTVLRDILVNGCWELEVENTEENIILPDYNPKIDLNFFITQYHNCELMKRVSLWNEYREKYDLDNIKNQNRRIARNKRKEKLKGKTAKYERRSTVYQENAKNLGCYENIRMETNFVEGEKKHVKEKDKYGLTKNTLLSSKKIRRIRKVKRQNLKDEGKYFNLVETIEEDFETKVKNIGVTLIHPVFVVLVRNVPKDVTIEEFLQRFPIKPTVYCKSGCKKLGYYNFLVSLENEEDEMLITKFFSNYKICCEFSVNPDLEYSPIRTWAAKNDFDIQNCGIGFDSKTVIKMIIRRDILSGKCKPPKEKCTLRVHHIYTNPDGVYLMFKNVLAYLVTLVFFREDEKIYRDCTTSMIPLIFRTGKEGVTNRKCALDFLICLEDFKGVIEIQQNFEIDLSGNLYFEIGGDKKNVSFEGGSSCFQGEYPSAMNNKKIEDFGINFRKVGLKIIHPLERMKILLKSFDTVIMELKKEDEKDYQLNDTWFKKYYSKICSSNFSVYNRINVGIGSLDDPGVYVKYKNVFKLKRRIKSFKERREFILQHVGMKYFCYVNQFPHIVVVKNENGFNICKLYVTERLRKRKVRIFDLGNETLDSAIYFEETDSVWGREIFCDSDGFVTISGYASLGDKIPFWEKEISCISLIIDSEIRFKVLLKGSSLHSLQHSLILSTLENIIYFNKKKKNEEILLNPVMEQFLIFCEKKVGSMKCGEIKNLVCNSNEIELFNDKIFRINFYLSKLITVFLTRNFLKNISLLQYGVISGLWCCVIGFQFYTRLCSEIKELTEKIVKKNKTKALKEKFYLHVKTVGKKDIVEKMEKFEDDIKELKKKVKKFCKKKFLHECSSMSKVDSFISLSRFGVSLCTFQRKKERPYCVDGITLFKLDDKKKILKYNHTTKQWSGVRFKIKSNFKYIFVINEEFELVFSEFIFLKRKLEFGESLIAQDREIKHSDLINFEGSNSRGSACLGGEFWLYKKILIFNNNSAFCFKRKDKKIISYSNDYDINNVLAYFFGCFSNEIIFIDFVDAYNKNKNLINDFQDVKRIINKFKDKKHKISLVESENEEFLQKNGFVNEDFFELNDNQLLYFLGKDNVYNSVLNKIKLKKLQKGTYCNYGSLFVNDITCNFYLEIKENLKDKNKYGIPLSSEERPEGFFSIIKNSYYHSLNGKVGFYNPLIDYVFFEKPHKRKKEIKRLTNYELENIFIHVCFVENPIFVFVLKQLLVEFPSNVFFDPYKKIFGFCLLQLSEEDDCQVELNSGVVDTSHDNYFCFCNSHVNNEMSNFRFLKINENLGNLIGNSVRRDLLEKIIQIYMNKKINPRKKFGKKVSKETKKVKRNLKSDFKPKKERKSGKKSKREVSFSEKNEKKRKK